MRRRDLLKTAAVAGLTAGAAPRLGRGADRKKTLVFVPTSDLQKQLWEDVPFIPVGEYWQGTGYRKDVRT
jgi:hypothetical protein